MKEYKGTILLGLAFVVALFGLIQVVKIQSYPRLINTYAYSDGGSICAEIEVAEGESRFVTLNLAMGDNPDRGALHLEFRPDSGMKNFGPVATAEEREEALALVNTVLLWNKHTIEAIEKKGARKENGRIYVEAEEELTPRQVTFWILDDLAQQAAQRG